MQFPDERIRLQALSRRKLIVSSLLLAGSSTKFARALRAGDSFFTVRPAGGKSDTKALQAAIDAAHAHGGGTVHIRAGRYTVGTLQLRSKVSLWLDSGATLIMSADLSEFLPVEKLAYNPKSDRETADFHHALLSGDAVEDIAIFGEGEIDCNRTKRGGPKPIALRSCSHVAIQNISIRNAPNYTISLLGCEFVTIDGVTLRNGFSDGIDPDCSRYVRITNCFVESVDDAICLKSSYALGELRPTEYVTVDNCILRTASIHFKCGTESCGGFREIAVSNCVFQGGMGMRHGNPGIALYTTDGGALEDVVISNIVMRDVGTPLAIMRGNWDTCSLGPPGPLATVRISNVVASGAKLPSVIAGLPDWPVTGVSIDGFSVSMANSGTGATALETIPEVPHKYPQPTMFGPLPAFGIFVRHASDVNLRDLHLQPAPGENRAAIVADDVDDLQLLDFEDLSNTSDPHLWFKDVRNSVVESIGAPPSRSQSYRVDGAETANLSFVNKTALSGQNPVLDVGQTVPPGAVRQK